jgi:lactate permease
MLLFICFIVLAQAYVFSWIVPEYQMLNPQADTSVPDFSKGYTYLLVLAVVSGSVCSNNRVNGKKDKDKTKAVDLSIVKQK